MARVRRNFVVGRLSAALTNTATTYTSAELAGLPAVAAPDIMVVVIDPKAEFGNPEIVNITAHAAGSTTATIVRGQEGTVARAHPLNARWINAVTAGELDSAITNLGGTITGNLIVNAGTASTIPLIVGGITSQTADLQQWQNSAGAVLARVTNNGDFINNITRSAFMSTGNTGYEAGTSMLIRPITAAGVGEKIRGLASQTGDLSQWQDSAGAYLSSVTSLGAFRTTRGLTILGSGASDGAHPSSDILIRTPTPQIEFYDTDMAAGASGRRWWIHHNGGFLYFLIDRDDNNTWDAPHPLYFTNTGVAHFGSDVNFNNTLTANGKRVLTTGDTFLRINQDSAFGSGIWTGSSRVKTGLGADVLVGSNGGDVGNVEILAGTGTANNRRIILDGNTGNATLTGALSAGSITTPAGGVAVRKKATFTADGWYRIASNVGDRAAAVFTVYDTTSSRHNWVKFSVARAFGAAPVVTILEANRYDIQTISEIRVVDASTYDPAYIEVYLLNTGGTVATDINTVMESNYWLSGWNLIDPVVGEVPTTPAGYKTYNYPVANRALTHSGPIHGLGGALVKADAATTVPAIFRGAVSQTANLTEWQDSSSTTRAFINPAGSDLNLSVGIGQGRVRSPSGWLVLNPAPGSHLYFGESSDTGRIIVRRQISPETASSVGLIITAAASQTANLQEWRASDGSVVARITPQGHIAANSFTGGSSTNLGYAHATLELYENGFAPRLSFHWGGTVASQISIENNGIISIRNNPGTGYESLRALDVRAERDIVLPRGDIAPAIITNLGIRFITDSSARIYNFDSQIFANNKHAGAPSVVIQGSGHTRNVTNKALTANVATLTTDVAHGFYVGRVVVVTGVDATFDGTYTIASIPSATTFTYSKTAADVASVAATGTARSYTQAVNLTEWRDERGTVMANLDRFGQTLTVGKLQFGFAGHDVNTYPGIVHADSTNKSATYALLNTAAGTTFINAASGQTLHFRISNATRANLTNSGFAIGSEGASGSALFVTSMGTTQVTTINRAIASQTVDIEQWQNSAGSVLAGMSTNGGFYAQRLYFRPTSAARVGSISSGYPGNYDGWSTLITDDTAGINRLMIDANGRVGIGNNNAFPGAQFGVTGNNSGVPVSITKGAAGQTGDLQQWQDSAGTVLSRVNANGWLVETFPGVVLTTGAGTADYGFLTPLATRAWFDRTRFTVPTWETSTDGATFTSLAHQAHLLSGRTENTTSIPSGGAIRVQWSGMSWSEISALFLGFSYIGVSNSVRVLIEYSADAVTWRTGFDKSGLNASANGLYIRPTAFISGDQYLRLTVFATTADTTAVRINSIQFLSTRMGDQGGGVQNDVPYSWNGMRTVVFQGVNASTVPLITRGQASQTGDLMQFQDSAGAVMARFASDGTLYIGSQAYTSSGSVAANAVTIDTVQTITGQKTFDTSAPGTITSRFRGNSITRSVTNKALTGNVATLTTDVAHAFYVGRTVVISGVDATFDGTYVITSIPSATTFTYARTAADVASVAATGTARSYAQTANLMEWGTEEGEVFSSVNNIGEITVAKATRLGATTAAHATMSVFGNKGGYAGFRFEDYGRTFMVNATVQGIYTGSAWQWYFNNGVLTAGSVPAHRVTAGAFTTGNYSLTGSFLTAASGATVVPEVVKGAASQTGDLTQWQDSAGNILARVASDGTIYKGNQAVGGNAADTEIMAIMGAF